MHQTIPTLIVIGNSILIPKESNIFLTKNTSLAISGAATYSALVEESVVLLSALDFHAIGAPQKYKLYPKTKILESFSPAYSLSEIPYI